MLLGACGLCQDPISSQCTPLHRERRTMGRLRRWDAHGTFKTPRSAAEAAASTGPDAAPRLSWCEGGRCEAYKVKCKIRPTV